MIETEHGSPSHVFAPTKYGDVTMHFRPPGPMRLSKRLARLILMATILSGLALLIVPPASAQDVEKLVRQNEALAKQVQLLMRQLQSNANRISALESALTARPTQSAATVPVMTAPETAAVIAPRLDSGIATPDQDTSLSERVEALEQKQAKVDQRRGGVATSGNKNVRLTVSGQINRGVLLADDGDQTEIYHVDNDNSSTRFRFVGEADIGSVTAGTNFEVEFESNSTNDINQNNQSTTTTLRERRMEFYLDHERLGRLSVGQGNTASDNTSEVDLSGTSVAAFSLVSSMAGGLLFYSNDTNGLTTTRIRDVSTNFDGLGRDDRVRYDTPSFRGFSAATSYASDKKWDVATRYAVEYDDFRTAAALAYSKPKGSVNNRYNGSISVLHSSGLNATFASGAQDYQASGRDDAWSIYTKLGYIVNWDAIDVAWMGRLGSTAFSVDFHRTEDLGQVGDKFSSYGIFAVQNVNDLGGQFYIGIRNHNLDRNGDDLEDVFATLVGGRIVF